MLVAMPHKKQHTSRTINALATIGYAALFLIVIQALAVVVIAIAQYAIVNNIDYTSRNSNSSGLVSTIFTFANNSTPESADSARPSVLATSAAWVALVAIGTILVVYMGRMAQKLVRTVATRFGRKGKATALLLFVTQLTLLATALGIVCISSLLLPAVAFIVPLNIALFVVGFDCFLVQYVAGRYWKYSTNNVL